MSAQTVTIAVDAMGGDFAPEATVAGALECAQEPQCDFHIALFGDEKRIVPLLDGKTGTERISVSHASEVIEMHDAATVALKSKKDSSLIRALEALRSGAVQGVISAGNSGAVMAASSLLLGRIPGVSRPTIGTFLPSISGWTLVVDAGANVDSKPIHLLHFGIMGSIYAGQIRGLKNPKVGLLNIGEEEGKGNEAAIAAYDLLQSAPVNFIGNVEGRDILSGTVDVVVTDGFAGNIILKFAESIPGFLKAKFSEAAHRNMIDKFKIGLVRGTMRRMMKDWDAQEQGGVPLLGVNGISIIGHGNSTAKAIRNMILRAKEMVDFQINDRIADAIAKLPSTIG